MNWQPTNQADDFQRLWKERFNFSPAQAPLWLEVKNKKIVIEQSMMDLLEQSKDFALFWKWIDKGKYVGSKGWSQASHLFSGLRAFLKFFYTFFIMKTRCAFLTNS